MRGRRQDLGLDVSTECDSWGNKRDRRSKTSLKSCFRERRAMHFLEVSSLFPPLSIARCLLKAYRFEILKLHQGEGSDYQQFRERLPFIQNWL